MAKTVKQLRVFIVTAKVLRLRTLFGLNFLQTSTNIKDPLYNSAAIEAVISLHFLLIECSEHFDIQVLFTDDISEAALSASRDRYRINVTGLIRFYRDVACHPHAFDKLKTIDKEQTIIFRVSSRHNTRRE